MSKLSPRTQVTGNDYLGRKKSKIAHNIKSGNINENKLLNINFILHVHV